jgi:hypothetical protein
VSINRYGKRIDANQTQVVSALRAAGFHVEILSKPVDLLVGAAGKWCLMEVKDGNKPKSAQKLTPAQVSFFDRYQKYPLFVVDSPDVAVAVVREFCK